VARKTDPARIAEWIESRNEIELTGLFRDYVENPSPELWKEIIDHINWMIEEDWEPIWLQSGMNMDPDNVREIHDLIRDWIEKLGREVGMPEDKIEEIKDIFSSKFSRVTGIWW